MSGPIMTSGATTNSKSGQSSTGGGIGWNAYVTFSDSVFGFVQETM